MKDQLIEKFKELFGSHGDIRCYFAPGRVNLIGEHTDYNGGHVFPCALTMGTYGAARKRKDKELHFYSMNFGHLGILKSKLTDMRPDPRSNWTNYPRGVIWAMEQRGYRISCGLDLMICGQIPNGSGLSSSASLEILTGYLLRDLFGFDLTNTDLALIGQYAENHYKGVKCGIMDQFAISMGKAEHAIFLDTSDLSFEYIPMRLNGVRLVITCSNKKRGLGDSKYNRRRSECEKALAQLQKVVDIPNLGALTREEFEQYQSSVTDPVRLRRARHAVLENERTLKAVAALRDNDIAGFGRLMNESHISLRDDYEVTGPELDALVEAAWKQPGVLGSRMTGAGFGGCTVSIVEEDAVENFKKQVGAAYRAKIGYTADFYTVEIGDGPIIL